MIQTYRGNAQPNCAVENNSKKSDSSSIFYLHNLMKKISPTDFQLLIEGSPIVGKPEITQFNLFVGSVSGGKKELIELLSQHLDSNEFVILQNPCAEMSLEEAFAFAAELLSGKKQVFVASNNAALFSLFAKNDAAKSWKIEDNTIIEISADDPTLIAAISPFVAAKYRALEKQSRFEQKILEQLKTLRTDASVLVFTEDQADALTMLKAVMRSNGNDDANTDYFTYGGKSKWRAAVAAMRSLKASHFPRVKTVIYHVDRDIDGDVLEAEFEKHQQTWEKLFMTPGYDLDSFFLNTNHIHALYPELNHTIIEEAIENALLQVQEKSIDKLADGLYQLALKSNDFGENMYLYSPSALRKKAIQMYSQNPLRYAYGKTVIGVLTGLLQSKVQDKGFKIFQQSSHLKIDWK